MIEAVMKGIIGRDSNSVRIGAVRTLEPKERVILRLFLGSAKPQRSTG